MYDEDNKIMQILSYWFTTQQFNYTSILKFDNFLFGPLHQKWTSGGGGGGYASGHIL